MADVVKPWVVARRRDGTAVAFEFDTDEQAVSFYVDIQALDVKTARVVSAKDESEAKEWL